MRMQAGPQSIWSNWRVNFMSVGVVWVKDGKAGAACGGDGPQPICRAGLPLSGFEWSYSSPGRFPGLMLRR